MSGFKSFVDPTSIQFPADVVGIVGPNGCGKSNVIDAVRWVMGEMSAKNLRGASMTDVIFNGSSARKPVGKASVELVFDNTQGKLEGVYAEYSEISVKRQLARDGQSDYFLNNAPCRRRDITDVFLGTGLGARSYSIIEQGMVGRIIEAKPEELRAFVEEAAGISRYKERRRETETRIRHTRENLQRVDDLRNELDGQLRRLQRQSQAARRYKDLKVEEREIKGQFMALKWRDVSDKLASFDRVLAEHNNLLEAELAGQSANDRQAEHCRVERDEKQRQLNDAQAAFYAVGADIASIEQSITHARETLNERKQEQQRLAQSVTGMGEQLVADRRELAAKEAELSGLNERAEQAQALVSQRERSLNHAESALQNWHAIWEQFGVDASAPVRERDVNAARISELERGIEKYLTRRERLTAEQQRIDGEHSRLPLAALNVALKDHDILINEHQAEIEHVEMALAAAREQRVAGARALEHINEERVDLDARLKSLIELQTSALGLDDERNREWLTSHGLLDADRLANCISVTAGWEKALDAVLSHRLNAIVVDRLDTHPGNGGWPRSTSVTFVERQPAAAISGTFGAHLGPRRLIEFVDGKGVELGNLLAGVYVAENLATALGDRSRLQPHECYVDRTGAIVGRDWMQVGGDKQADTGIVQRGQAIEQLRKDLDVLEQSRTKAQQDNEDCEQSVLEHEEQLAQKRRELTLLMSEAAESRDQLGRVETTATRLLARRQEIDQELNEITEHIDEDRTAVSTSQESFRLATELSGSLEERRERLIEERERLVSEREAAVTAHAQAREQHHECELTQQGVVATLQSLQNAITRLEGQSESANSRLQTLAEILEQGDAPEQDLQARLKTALAERESAEQHLNVSRSAVGDLDHQLAELQKQRIDIDACVQERREALEAHRVDRQELVVRRQTIHEQISEHGETPDRLVESLPEDATESDWQGKLEALARRIERIGPVNLVAIEEFEEQSERKTYLDKQHADLSEALATLEGVIRKIDKETRERFRETFDALNKTFQEYFPKLFGGGHATIELTDDDMLTAGVSVMARPPGKRNSSIQLLSGGEKAMTAVALLFSFFTLNPAPFCFLDEVDAPLDDANVLRYTTILRSLAERTQLIYITHNKITMEAADVLIGVTMGEPGVSRLVAVDVDQALEMASQ